MIKVFAFILSAVLCFSLCACGLVPESEVVYVPVDESHEAEPSSQASAVESEDEAEVESANELLAILEELYGEYHPGTAGSSLKLAAIAGELMDWYAQSGSVSAMSRATAAFAAAHDDYSIVDNATEIAAGFPVSLMSVWNSAAELCLPGGEALLEGSGYTKQSDWESANVEQLFTMLYGALGLELPECFDVYYGIDNKLSMPAETVNEHIVFSALVKAKVFSPDIVFNAFIHDGENLRIDFSKELTPYLNSLDAAGEHNALGCLVLTLLEAFDAKTITITVDGKALSTNYGTYDFAISRSDV